MDRTITTDELAALLDPADLVDDQRRVPFILDVRAPAEFERWRIEGKVTPETVNVPYWTALGAADETKALVPSDRDVVVVCAHGGSSDMVIDTLGFDRAANLAGGMDAWANTLVPHPLLDDGSVFVVQVDRIAKACLSYAIGERGEEMAVIDPGADLDWYLALSEEAEAPITHLFDTHLHADHISIARELADRTGAEYHIAEGDAEEAVFDYTPLRDGETFTLGTVEIIVRSIATPGHTPGSTSLEVMGEYLMTGDAVFVSGIGRPDLGGQTAPWARDLFHTIHDRLAVLDHDLLVSPAHYTARNEANAGGILQRRLGDLLTNDPVVSIDDEENFVEHVVNHLGEPPEQYSTIRKVNLGVLEADDEQKQELEVGRNECALSK